MKPGVSFQKSKKGMATSTACWRGMLLTFQIHMMLVYTCLTMHLPVGLWRKEFSSLNVRVNGIGGYICIAQCTQAIIMWSDAAQHWHWWCAEVSMMLSAEMSNNFINFINASIARWEMNASMIGTTIEQAWCKIIVGCRLDSWRRAWNPQQTRGGKLNSADFLVQVRIPT